MSPEAEEKLNAFFRNFAEGAKPLLLLDYDGTLAPFRVGPVQGEAVVWSPRVAGTHSAAGSDAHGCDHRAARSRDRADARLDPPLEVWGLHGAERLYPDGRRELEQASDEVRQKLDEIRAQLRNDSLAGSSRTSPTLR